MENETRVDTGHFFILGGLTVYVAEKGEPIEIQARQENARLRVIYSNGTESDLLPRSLQRALYKDKTSRRLTDLDTGPLFDLSENGERGDEESGTRHILRSASKYAYVAEHRELIHKIGVTGDKVRTRIANAVNESTYLLADVEIVAEYKLTKINRMKLEKLLRRIFALARIDLTIPDRFGHPLSPKEWYLVPLPVIDKAVQHIRDGSITGVLYDPQAARLVEK